MKENNDSRVEIFLGDPNLYWVPVRNVVTRQYRKSSQALSSISSKH